jgi:hypothetical protein
MSNNHNHDENNNEHAADFAKLGIDWGYEGALGIQEANTDPFC